MAEAFLSRVLRPMVSRALKRALGGVFDLEKTAELEFAALKGVIAVTDVKIHPGLSIPGLELVEGHVGRLEVKIPWQRLGSEAVQVHISDVNVTFRLSQIDEGVADVVKRQRLRAAEMVARAEDAEDEAVEEDATAEDTSTAGSESSEKRRRWIDRVLENIAFTAEQLKIKVLSRQGLQYEVALCFMIDSVSLETTDSEGRPAYVTRQDETHPLNRKGLIRGFSIQVFESASSVVGATILEPMWISCVVEDRSRERRIADCRLGPVRVRLGPSHLKSLLHFMSSKPPSVATTLTIASPTSRRMLSTQRRSLKAWVQYVIIMKREERRRLRNKTGWIHYLQRMKDRSAYVRLYIKRMMELDAASSSSKKEAMKMKMSDVDSKELEKLEKKLPFPVVLLFRSFAEAELAYASNNNATSIVSSVPEKKKSSRFTVVAKIRGRLKRKKSSAVQLEPPNLNTVERQRLYEEAMNASAEFALTSSSKADAGATGDLEEFGSSLIALKALSFELTLLRAGGSDSSFLRLRAREIAFDANFFVDTKPVFDFSLGKLECVDELTERKVISFLTDGYSTVERPRRTSTGSVDTHQSSGPNPSPTPVTRKSVKPRSSFVSRHLMEWKDPSIGGRPQDLDDFTSGKAKVVGRLGGKVKVSPVQVTVTCSLLRELMEFIPNASSQGASSSTQWVFDAPKLAIVSDTDSPLVNLDADTVEWTAGSGSFLRCGIAFGKRPRCLPLDMVMLGREMEIALSEKDPSARIRLEITSDTIEGLIFEMRSVVNADAPKQAMPKTPASSSLFSFSGRVLSIVEFALVDLDVEMRLDAIEVQPTSAKSTRVEVVKVVPKRRRLAILETGVHLTIDKGMLNVESSDAEALNSFAWDCSLLRSLRDLRTDRTAATSTRDESKARTLKLRLLTPFVVDFPVVTGTRVDGFCRMHVQGGIEYSSDLKEARVIGPVQAESVWLVPDGRADNEFLGDEELLVNKSTFFTCDKDLVLTFPTATANVRATTVKATGMVEYQHHQTLALELNDYFQTQILPVMTTNTRKKLAPSTYSIACLHGFKMSFFPAGLPKDLTSSMDRVQIDARKLEIASAPKSQGKEVISVVLDQVELFRVPGADAEPSSDIDYVFGNQTDCPFKLMVRWERADLTEEQETSLMAVPMLFGVRKGDFALARKRANRFAVSLEVGIKEKAVVLEVSRQFARLIPILLSENIQDFRRQRRSPDDADARLTAEKWTSVLPHELLPVVRGDDDSGADKFLIRELMVTVDFPLHLELKLSPTESRILISSDRGLAYVSREMRSLTDSAYALRTANFTFKGGINVKLPSSANEGINLDCFELHRSSTGANRDELHALRIGPVEGQSLWEDFPLVMTLATFLTRIDQERQRMFGHGVDPATDRWAKYFRLAGPVQWKSKAENMTLSLQGAMLQARKRKEIAYTLQCLLDQPTFLENAMAFRVDGMHAGLARQHSILCDPVRVRSTLIGISSAVEGSRSSWKTLRSQVKQLKEIQYSFERETNHDDAENVTALGTAKRKPDTLIVVALRGFQFTLLTSNGKPCLRSFASKTICRAQMKGRNPEKALSFTFFDEDGVSGLGLGVSYFNQAIIKWEPLLEQCLFNVELKWNESFDSYGCTVESTDPVRLNVTVAGIEALKRLTNNSTMTNGASLSKIDAGKGTGEISSETYSEWIFENDSGEDVTLQLHYNDAPPVQTIPNGAKLPLKDFDSKEIKSATIGFGEDFHSLQSVPLGAVGYFVYSIYPKFAKQRHTRMVQVSLSICVCEGSMVVRVCSSVTIENLTNVPLEVLLMPTPQEEAGEELTGRSALLGPLAPERTLSLPIQSLTTRLSIRPFSPSLAYSWWTGMSVFTLEPGSFQGTCEASAPTKEDPKKTETFAFHVCVMDTSVVTGTKAQTDPSHSAATKRDGRYQIVFLPGLTVINALPVALDYRFSGQTERFHLEPGEKGAYHSPGTKVLFRLGNSAWSVPVAVRDPDPKQDPFILLEDSTGKHLKLLLDIKPGMGGAPRVTVFAKAWFLNRSGLPLAYRVGDTGLRLFDTKSAPAGSSPFATMKGEHESDAGLQLVDIKIGSVCEFLVGEDWKEVVIVGLREADSSFDVVLTESSIKVGGVKPAQLRKATVLANASSNSLASSIGNNKGNEYVLFSESSGTLQVKVDSTTKGSMWSHPFAIENIGTDGVLQLKREVYPPSMHSGIGALNVLGPSYVLGIQVSSSSFTTTLKPTPIVTLVPRHVVMNKLSPGWGLVLCSDTDLGNRVTMTEERMTLHCASGKVRLGLERLLDFANRVEHPSLTRSGFKLSGIVDISKPCQESVKLHNKRSGECVVLKVRADWLDSQSPTLVCTVSMSKTPADAIYWIANETKGTVVHYYQILPEGPNTSSTPTLGVVERVFPGEGKEFGWDELEGDQRVIELDFGGGKSLLRIRPDDLSASPFRKGTYVVRTFVQGVTKYVSIMEEELVRGWTHVDDDKGEQDEAADEDDDFSVDNNDDDEATIGEESDEKDIGDSRASEIPLSAASWTYHVMVRLSSVSISFVDSFPQEIVALHISDVDLTVFRRVSSSKAERHEEFSVALSAKYVQLDNCTLNARLPVILWPAGTRQSFLNAAFSGRISSQLVMVSKLQMTVAPFDLYLEERVILLGLRMFSECRQILVSSKALKKSLMLVQGESSSTSSLGLAAKGEVIEQAVSPEEEKSFMSKTVFVEKAKIDPLMFTITIQRLVDEDPITVLAFPRWRGPGTSAAESSASASDDQSFTSVPTVESILSKLPSAFTDVDRANVALASFESRRDFSTIRQVVHRTKRKYSQELLANVYRILSTELMRVVSPIGAGLRVEDAGSGLLHGAYGALDAASKVSGAIGSGAAFLSMDSKFVSSRRQALIDERPDGLGTGVVLGAKAIGTGLLLGLTGVVTQPIYGASEGGVAGFVAGVGKGIVGVGVKPVVGVFDMVASVFAGARSATAWLDPSETPRRARLPRTIGGEARALQPFDARAALVQELLVKLWGVDRWRSSVQGDGTLEFRLLESDSLVLVRVDTVLVCVDYGSYSQLLQEERVDLSSFNAARPIMAWEIDGRAIESFEIDHDEEQTVVVNLQYVNKAGAVSGYGRSGGIVLWRDGKWIMRLPTFSEENLGFLCRALQRIVVAASLSVPGGSENPSSASDASVSHFGLSTTASEAGKCIVSGVQPASYAEKCGFLQGDVVLGFFGRPLSKRDIEGAKLHEAIAFMMREGQGTVMDVTVERDDVVHKLAIRF